MFVFLNPLGKLVVCSPLFPIGMTNTSGDFGDSWNLTRKRRLFQKPEWRSFGFCGIGWLQEFAPNLVGTTVGATVGAAETGTQDHAKRTTMKEDVMACSSSISYC
jgi:hypothetical protein